MLVVLLTVNGAMLAVNLLQSPGWQAGVLEFVEKSLQLELSCLSSLFVLCGLRRILRLLPRWQQHAACALLPAAVATAVAHLLGGADWFGASAGPDAIDGSGINAALAAALFGLLLQHYFALRTRAFSPALAEARLQALQARIRPHFLFNSLNAVLSLIRTEPRQAESTLEDLADLFRVLMRDARDIVTLDDEIRVCQQYLAIEKIRLGDRLVLDWELQNVDDTVLRTARIPSLLLQPLLENAVHYGVEPVATPVQITVRVRRSLDRIDIVVRNPLGAAASVTAHHSVGNHMALANIRERLLLFYDVEAGLVTSSQDGWFEARLHFPYRKEVL
ncbi:MAG: histidine kinase [Herminiimonas sp.]|nr:histidine kinase [Herminiimonas sp.]